MTPNQYASHKEQIEAARAEFDRLWSDKLIGAALNLKVSNLGTIHHCCWLAFLSAKGLAPTKKIESQIQIPPRGHAIVGKWKGLLLKMKPGDSFHINDERERNTIYSSAKCQGIKIASRKINGSGYRIWRIR